MLQAIARGLCSKHYQRLRNHGDPKLTKEAPKGARLAWMKAHVGYTADDCLLIPFKRRPDGYGTLRINRAYAQAHWWNTAGKWRE